MNALHIDPTEERWREPLLRFCASAAAEGDAASANMDPDGWELKPHTLMFLCLSERRFDTGALTVVLEGDDIVALSGCYVSDFDPMVMVCGVRAFTLPSHRTQFLHGRMIFPLQFELARSRGCKACVLTFNDYNVGLRRMLQRIADGRAIGFGFRNSEFYKDLTFPPEPMMIKQTLQWIAVKALDPGYEPRWP